LLLGLWNPIIHGSKLQGEISLMMRSLRENTGVILWILVLAFLATIIFSWGAGGFDSFVSDSGSTVATVNDEDLDIRFYEQLVENRLNNETQGERADANQTRTARRASWNDMVHLTLEKQLIQTLDLDVQAPEISDRVMYFPPEWVLRDSTFLTLGEFDTLKWHDVLRTPNMTNFLLQMETSLNNSIPHEKLRSRLQASAIPSLAELRDDFIQKNQTASANYMLFSYADQDLAEDAISDADMQAYFKSHREDYAVDENRVIDYVQIKVEPSREDTLDALDQMEYLKRQLDKGEEFGDLAATYSMDASNADRGGDLGWFAAGQMVPAFEEAAFAAEIGSLVGPIETRFGWHLIKINGHELRDNSQGEPVDQVQAQHILVKLEISSMTHADRRAIADALYEDVAEGGDFDVLAATRNLEVIEGKPVTAKGSLPGLGRTQRANDLVFAAAKGAVLKPIFSDGKGWFVVRLKDVIAEGTNSFDNVATSIRTAISKTHKEALALETAEAFLATHPGLTTLSEDLNDKGSFGTLDQPIKINQFIRGDVGRDLAFTTSLFDMEAGSISDPVVGDKGVYILQSLAIDGTDDLITQFEKEQSTRLNDAMTSQRNANYMAWTRVKKAASTIEDNRSKFGFDY
jgi:parvulin-like peptidyl-prolyl isomerase